MALSTLTVDLRRRPPITKTDEPRPPASSPGWPRAGAGCRAAASATAAVVGFLLPFLPVVAVILGLVWVGRRLARDRRTPAGGAERPGT